MKLRFLYTLFAFVVIGFLNLNYTNGPATVLNMGYTGAPGDNASCSIPGCHSDANSFESSLSLVISDAAGPVTTYIPDSLYDITITVNTNAGTPDGYGFQLLSLKDADDSDLAAWSNPSANAKIVNASNGRSYLEHNGKSATNTFTAQWRAPSAGAGNVSLYGVGNAVDGMNGNAGDDPTPAVSIRLSEDVSSFVKDANRLDISMHIFPNPVANKLNIKLDGKLNGTYNLEVLDGLGRLASQKTMELQNGQNHDQLDASALAPGMYMIRLSNEEGFATKQFIKK